ncbi:hypothetical protein COV82_05565 [Candidatus Peregrinibacteria bacterium CG11_big_fil_rev_8_21_14_0_20_46_8]|nr:MAG: hypothetical protein COV82_05565 [Candidatus Peregrinibacteria bacterium CG11_big_fil_rev_8_21_14_0_20_46_8]
MQKRAKFIVAVIILVLLLAAALMSRSELNQGSLYRLQWGGAQLDDGKGRVQFQLDDGKGFSGSRSRLQLDDGKGRSWGY